MLINEIEILSSKTLYSPQWFGLAAGCIFFLTGLILLGGWLDSWFDDWAAYIGIINIILAFTIIPLSNASFPNFLNKPSKIQYEIEIMDDNAWKEIGPNYTVKSKLYETKEIYVIEGDYINENNN